MKKLLLTFLLICFLFVPTGLYTTPTQESSATDTSVVQTVVDESPQQRAYSDYELKNSYGTPQKFSQYVGQLRYNGSEYKHGFNVYWECDEVVMVGGKPYCYKPLYLAFYPDTVYNATCKGKKDTKYQIRFTFYLFINMPGNPDNNSDSIRSYVGSFSSSKSTPASGRIICIGDPQANSIPNFENGILCDAMTTDKLCRIYIERDGGWGHIDQLHTSGFRFHNSSEGKPTLSSSISNNGISPNNVNISYSNGSGAYSKSNSNYPTSTSTIFSSGTTFTEEGRYTIQAKNNNGWIAETHFTIDKSAPIINASFNGSQLVIQKTTDTYSSIGYVRVNGKDISANGTTIDIVPNGEYMIEAADNLGNSTSKKLVASDNIITFIKSPADYFQYSASGNNYESVTLNNYNIKDLQNTKLYYLPNTTYTFSISDKFDQTYTKEFYSNALTLNSGNSLNNLNNYYFSDSGVNINNYNYLKISNYIDNYSLKVKNKDKILNHVSNENDTFSLIKGEYELIVTDYLNNQYVINITSTKEPFAKDTYIDHYYEQRSMDGSSFVSFASKENAIMYGIERERQSVELYNDWTDTAAPFPGGCPIASGDKAIPGQKYYKYKSIDSSNLIVAYFNETLLEQALSFYSNQSLKEYYFFDKNPATPADGENLYYNTNIYAKYFSVYPYGDVYFEICKPNGELITIIDINSDNFLFDQAGSYVIHVKNSFDIEYTQNVIILDSAPYVFFAFSPFGNSTSGTMLNDNTKKFTQTLFFRAYSLDERSKMFVYKDKSDSLIQFAYNNVDNYYYIPSRYDNKVQYYTYLPHNALLKLDVSGKYRINTINGYNPGKEYEIALSLSAPTIDVSDDEENRRLLINIAASNDYFVKLINVKIYSSVDKVNWTLLDKDDSLSNRKIDLSAFKNNLATFSFVQATYYKIVVQDDFYGTVEKVTDNIYERSAPTGKIANVYNNAIFDSYYNQNIKFVWDKDAIYNIGTFVTYKLYTPGLIGEPNEREYTYNESLYEEGKYVFFIQDRYSSKKNVYEIIIDKTAPTANININAHKFTNNDVNIQIGSTQLYTAPLLKFEYAYNYGTLNIVTDFADFISLIEEGYYKIFLYDMAGNKFEADFTIDKTAPKASLGNVSNGGHTNLKKGKPMISNFFDGKFGCDTKDIVARVHYTSFVNDNWVESNYEISANTNFSEEGYYAIYLFDLAGNKSIAYTFTIDLTTPDIRTNIVSGNIGNEDVVFEWNKPSKFESPITATYTFNNATYNYDSGLVLQESGNYKLVISDLAGNVVYYEFTIDKIPPVFTILDNKNKIIPIGDDNTILTNKHFKINCIERNVSIIVNDSPYNLGTLYSTEDIYYIYAVDEAGNHSLLVTVQLSTKLPIIEFFNNKNELIGNSYTIKDGSALVKMMEKYDFSVFRMLNSGEWTAYDNYKILSDKEFTLQESGIFKISTKNDMGFAYDYFIKVRNAVEYKLMLANSDKDYNDITNTDVKLSWNETTAYLDIKKDNKPYNKFNIANNSVIFTEEGNYIIKLFSGMDDSQTIYLSIDKSAPTLQNILDSQNNNVYSKDILTLKNAGILTFNADENIASLQIYKNKKLYAVVNSNSFDFSNLYGEITVAVIDKAGNYTQFEFINEKQIIINTQSKILIGIFATLGGLLLIGIVSFIILNRMKTTNKKVAATANNQNTDTQDDNIYIDIED